MYMFQCHSRHACPLPQGTKNCSIHLCLFCFLTYRVIIQFSSDQFSGSFVSDSLRPHRRQPTRLPRPWDSPGKNTGVGCHFLLQCMKAKSESEVAQSCPIFSDPMDNSPPGSPAHGIFQARVLEWGAIAFYITSKLNFLKPNLGQRVQSKE